jgi:hypothetical protein
MDDKQLASLKPGDRVRITFEGVVTDTADGSLDVLAAGGRIPCSFDSHDLPGVTCEVLPKPLAVGDRVWVSATSRGVIIAIHKGWAWIEFAQTQDTGVYALGLLKHAYAEDYAHAT